jgi:glycosyltransferase involved in cell wall biosynthesis
MKIGLFEAGLPNCSYDAGSTAIIELCTLALSMGHEIEYIYTGDNVWGRTEDLTNNKIPFCQIATRDNKIKLDFLKNKNLDVTIISRPGTTIEWLYVCEEANIPVIYFGHDIHYERLKLGNNFLPIEKQVSVRDIRIMQTLEYNIWKKCDVLLYPSKKECDVINEYCKKDSALEMPLYDIEIACEEFFKSNADVPKIANSLLFVGGSHHMPNADAMIWFAKDVLQKIKSNISLSIVGDWQNSIKNEIIKFWNINKSENQKLEFCGRIWQDDLYNKYRSSALVIAPLRFGAGVKRKVVESIAFRCPILGTEISFEGLDIQPQLAESIVSQIDPEIYAKKLDSLLNLEYKNISGEIEKFAKKIVTKYSKNYRKKILEKSFSMI